MEETEKQEKRKIYRFMRSERQPRRRQKFSDDGSEAGKKKPIELFFSLLRSM